MTTATAATRKKLNPLMFLPGLVFWPIAITGVVLEDQNILTAAAVVLAIMLGFFGVRALRRGAARRREEGRVWHEGSPATARVITISSGGGSLNDHPRIDFELEVSHQGRVYQATASTIIDQLAIPRIQPGCEIVVRVDPNDPSKVAIDDALTYLDYVAA